MSLFWKSVTFTDSIRKLIVIIHFRINILWKILKLVFKRNKKLRKKTLYFSNERVFDKSVFTLNYNFDNALYYEIKGLHKSLNGQSIDIYHSHFQKPLELIVHGFGHIAKYYLTYEVTEKIESEKFTVSFLNYFKIEKLNLKLSLSSNKFMVIQRNITPKISAKRITNTNLKYKSTTFNHKEFT